MKKRSFIVLLFVAILGYTHTAFAQTSDRTFSFQGYAIAPDGKALEQTGITVKFTIYNKNNTAQEMVEEQALTTDSYGAFVAQIGSSSTSDFLKQNFAAKNADYWLKVEVKATSGGSYTTIQNARMQAVPYARFAYNGVPVGTIIPFAGDKTQIPEGWLVCDGTQYDGTDAEYTQLFNVLGNAWGGSGSLFNVPDLRGMFLRGVDEGKGSDPEAASRTAIASGGNTGDKVGTLQGGATARPNTNFSTSTEGEHSHAYTDPAFGGGNDVDWSSNIAPGKSQEYPTTNGGTTVAAGNHSHTITSGGDAETRPVNAAVYYIIKY